MRKKIAVIVLSLVLGAFTMGAEGCQDPRKIDTPEPTQLPSQQWGNPVKHGTWCDGREGEKAFTATGIPVVCKTNPGEHRPRWRNG